jgi:hypothetical protein
VLSRPVSDSALTEQFRGWCQKIGLSWPPVGEFKPVIYYNEALGVAHVLIADTSYSEMQVTTKHFLGIFERNHHSRYGEEHFVGFSLWVVEGACALMGIEPVGKLSMRKILDFLYEREEDQFVKDVIREIALPMLEQNNLDEFEVSTQE